MAKLWELILQTSFYASVVGVIIILSKAVLKNNINARYHYLIWMLLIIKLIIPFGPESNVSLFNKIPVINVYENNIDYVENTETQDYYNFENYNSSQYKQSINSTDSSAMSRNNSLKEFIPIIWMIGCINILATFTISHYLLNKSLNKESKDVGEDKYEILKNCKDKINIKSNISVLINESVKTPSLVGIIKPKILIPSSMINLSDQELGYIFLHELSHYKRKDIVVNYLLIILQSIHWFNPMIWYFFKRIREDMELATDERVLKTIKEDEHKEYGKAILTVLERIKISKRTLGVIGMINDKKTIKNRIEQIKNMKFMKHKKILFSTVGIVSIIALSIVLLTSAKESDEMKYAKSLYQYKTQYIGDASNISNLLSKLEYGENKTGIELQTAIEPYGLKVYYEFNEGNKEEIENQMYSNAVIIFSLIENLDYIEFEIYQNNKNYKLEYNKEDVNKVFNQLITLKANNLESFNGLITYL
ncbi:MAG: M56 family metallopeptidase, partial [Peptostreptococcaceae bacterium]